MTSTLPFSIVDVFSTTPYKGNPLAVVSSLSPAVPLTKSQHQHITRQFNLSETTFFSPPSLPKAKYALRSFLPDGREVFGAGHNILGVWWYLASAGLLDLSSAAHANGKEREDGELEWEFWQELGGQVLPVRILKSNGGQIKVSIRQAPPQSHKFHPDLSSLAKSIGITESDIGFRDSNRPLRPQVLSTSTTKHLQVPLSSIEALNRVSVQRDELLKQLALVDDHAYGLYLFTKTSSETSSNSYQARFFSPGMSGEDPATGSAAGPLALYLYEHGELELVDGMGVITVLQGLKVGRECLITVTLTKGSDGVVNVDFSGAGVSVASGDIALPALDLAF